MNKKEKAVVSMAITELMKDNGDFYKAIGELSRLVGGEYPIYELLKRGSVKGTSIADLAKKESSFKVKYRRRRS